MHNCICFREATLFNLNEDTAFFSFWPLSFPSCPPFPVRIYWNQAVAQTGENRAPGRARAEIGTEGINSISKEWNGGAREGSCYCQLFFLFCVWSVEYNPGTAWFSPWLSIYIFFSVQSPNWQKKKKKLSAMLLFCAYESIPFIIISKIYFSITVCIQH